MMKTLSIPMGYHSLIWRKAATVAQQAGEFEDKATSFLSIPIPALGFRLIDARSGFHVQVDFCAHPLLVLFGQSRADQSFTTLRIRKQRRNSGAPFELFVQALQPIGGAHAHPGPSGKLKTAKPSGTLISAHAAS